MRIYLTSSERKPDPEPLPSGDRRTVLLGMAVWALLWVAALVLHSRLAEQGRGWWVWTPPVGIALGFLGLRYLRGWERRERERLERERLERERLERERRGR